MKAPGYRVLTVRSVNDALQQLRAEPIQLVVLDVLFGEQMDPDGITLAAAMSQHDEWRLLPVLFLTVHPADEVRRELKERRVPVSPEHVRVMSKPFDFPDFRRNVEELLRARSPHLCGDKEGP